MNRRLMVLLAAVSVGAGTCDDDLTLLRGTLFGRVCSESGRSVGAGIEVQIVPREGPRLLALTDASGAWEREEVPHGAVVVVYENPTREIDARASAGERTEVLDALCGVVVVEPELPVATGSVAGCLCDATGEIPLGGAEVSLEADDVVYPLVADADGCFVAEEIPVGTHPLSIRHAALTMVVEVTVLEGQIASPPSPPRCEPCLLEDSITPESTTRPSDIIWVVDNSSSMDLEESRVQGALNDWSQRISASGIDHRVVLLADASNITVPAPLGGSPEFLHVDVGVGSENALTLLLSQYPAYKDFLRDDSVKHFVVVTDDDSEMSANAFTAGVNGLVDPAFGAAGTDWFVHAIVGVGDVPIIGCFGAANEGNEYISLSTSTGGVLSSLCAQDWDPIFDAIEDAVVNSALGCGLALPPGTEVYDIDLEDIHLVANAVQLQQVEGETTCDGASWYLDEVMGIVPCPDACADVLAGDLGSIAVEVGCNWR